jgi:1,4-alpha-glucan branching enzyme
MVRIPATGANTVEVRFASLLQRDHFEPQRWRREPLERLAGPVTWWELDIDALGLPDGDYEYEFVLSKREHEPVADPFADEIVRFGGYRGVFHIRQGRLWRAPFSWDDELTDGVTLPPNDRLVIYEMPLRWMAPAEEVRQIGLGTFDRVIFERLEGLAELGVNAIELLPVQDSPDTLNWGYGTRFFLAPDIDMGTPVDLKALIKRCHQRGMRVLLDVVMNHAKECPLERLADDLYFLRKRDEEPGRGEDYGARLVRYRRPAPDGSHPAREFHYAMAEHWIREYHIDGFRIDEFRGIDNWEFVQAFREHAERAFRTAFPDRPFLVVAEDSWRRAEITKAKPTNPGGPRVVDAMWNFSLRDEARRLLRNEMETRWGEPSRGERIVAAISGKQLWDDLDRSFHEGFDELTQAVNYITSHDVEKPFEQRIMNLFVRSLDPSAGARRRERRPSPCLGGRDT